MHRTARSRPTSLAILLVVLEGCASQAQPAERVASPAVTPGPMSPTEPRAATAPPAATRRADASLPACSQVTAQGTSCSGTLDGVRGCRYLAERKCGEDNYRILCLDRWGADDSVSIRYVCTTPVVSERRARKNSMGLCSSDRDCAAGPGWEEVCFSTVVGSRPTQGQCGDLRLGVFGNDHSVASNVLSEPVCSSQNPCSSGETCIRLLSARTNVCVTMQ